MHEPVVARDRDDGVSVLDALVVIMRQRYVILGFACVALVAMVAWTALSPRMYTAIAAFVPQSTSASSSVAGLAAQLGFSVATGEPGETPEFYATLLVSDVILGPVVDSSFAFNAVNRRWFSVESTSVHTTLADLFGIQEDNAQETRARVIEELRSHVQARTTPSTGVVSLRVTMPWPVLSHLIAVSILEHVNDFNLERRQRAAGVERDFIEGRLGQAQNELRESENHLEGFLERNRNFGNSPELQFQHDRLQRAIALKQQTVSQLTQAFEKARIDEVRNTPVITIIQPSRIPALADPRHFALRAFVGMLMGGIVGAVIAFAREFFARGRASGTREFMEFEQLRSEMAGDLRRIGRRRR